MIQIQCSKLFYAVIPTIFYYYRRNVSIAQYIKAEQVIFF